MNQVADTAGNFAPAGALGTFNVNVPTVPPPPPPPPPAARLNPFLLVSGPPTGTGNFYAPTGGGQFGPAQTFPLIPGFGGELRVALGDVNNDGFLDFIAGTGPGAARVVVLNGFDGSQLATLDPFPGHTGGVYVAAGDLNGDGNADVVVTPDAADAFNGPVDRQLPIRVYTGAGFGVLAAFDGLASLSGASGQSSGTKLGGRTAVADVNGDGRPDLLVAAGNGGGPRVTIWDGAGFAGANGGRPTANPLANLFVFESSQRGGAFVTSGDVDGDGRAEVIVGGGPGGGPRVRIVDGAKLLALPPAQQEGVDLDLPQNLASGLVRNNYFAGPGTSRGGVRLAVVDVDADGKADVVTGSGTGEASAVRVYTAAALIVATGQDGVEPTKLQTIDPFGGAVLPGGVWVG